MSFTFALAWRDVLIFFLGVSASGALALGLKVLAMWGKYERKDQDNVTQLLIERLDRIEAALDGGASLTGGIKQIVTKSQQY